MNSIKNLSPQSVWSFFYDFTTIPRPSKHEERILEYLEQFAKSRGLEYRKDKTGNIVILKGATLGKEGLPVVALQGHVDMVCEANSDTPFDFMTQPIESYIDGEWVKARGTTLGADCGIGCALMLAVLDSNELEHPAIEAVFTVDEETGLTGAFGIEEGMITAKYLINLDSEDAGELFVGCAGGIDTIAKFTFDKEPLMADWKLAQISVRGLKGGHSGDDINKEYGNSNIITARFLLDNPQVRIVDIDGGNLRNAIPREATTTIAYPASIQQELAEKAKQYNQILKKELFTSDAAVDFQLESTTKSATETFSAETTATLVGAIVTAPNGVLAMSQDMENFVETSTNLASIKEIDGKIVISTSQRSSVESRKIFWAKVMRSHFEKYGAEVTQSEGYPGWTPVLNSHLLDVFKQQHKDVLGYELKVKAVHAGLECGLFLAKFPQLEMVSYGPTLRGVHSPDEKLLIPAVEEAWRLLKSVLKNL